MITGKAADIPVVALFDATVTPPVVSVKPVTATLFTFSVAGVAWLHRRRTTDAIA